MTGEESPLHLSPSVLAAVRAEAGATGESVSAVMERLVCEALGLHRHTLFQVSTGTALAEGVFDGAITVRDLLGHGDFGIGTYDRLDGELVLLDGRCFRAGAGGRVEEASPEWTTPFAVVTRFTPDVVADLDDVGSLAGLQGRIDDLRSSDNVFVAVRVTGTFDRMSLRAACRARPGEGLVEATSHQSEFSREDVAGTMIGFWTPEYVSSVGIPGYHFHFLAEDRTTGGHVLDVVATDLRVELDIEREVHVALPTTKEFLEADLRADATQDLEVAESAVADRPHRG